MDPTIKLTLLLIFFRIGWCLPITATAVLLTFLYPISFLKFLPLYCSLAFSRIMWIYKIKFEVHSEKAILWFVSTVTLKFTFFCKIMFSWHFASIIELIDELSSFHCMPACASTNEKKFEHCERVVKNWASSSLHQVINKDKNTLQDLLFFLHVPRTGGRSYYHW